MNTFTRVRSAATVLLIVGHGGCDASEEPGAGPERGVSSATGKADTIPGSCDAAVGGTCGYASNDACWCDDSCAAYGDCCADIVSACGLSRCSLSSGVCPEGTTCQRIDGDALFDCLPSESPNSVRRARARVSCDFTDVDSGGIGEPFTGTTVENFTVTHLGLPNRVQMTMGTLSAPFLVSVSPDGVTQQLEIYNLQANAWSPDYTVRHIVDTTASLVGDHFIARVEHWYPTSSRSITRTCEFDVDLVPTEPTYPVVQIRSESGRCLTSPAGEGRPTLAPCSSDALAQRWTITPTRRIRAVSSGLCLARNAYYGTSRSDPAMKPCDQQLTWGRDDVPTVFELSEEAQLRSGAEVGRCLGPSRALIDCSRTSYLWNLRTNGELWTYVGGIGNDHCLGNGEDGFNPIGPIGAGCGDWSHTSDGELAMGSQCLEPDGAPSPCDGGAAQRWMLRSRISTGISTSFNVSRDSLSAVEVSAHYDGWDLVPVGS